LTSILLSRNSKRRELSFPKETSKSSLDLMYMDINELRSLLNGQNVICATVFMKDYSCTNNLEHLNEERNSVSNSMQKEHTN